MPNNNIEELQREIKSYNRRIERHPKDDNSYYRKAETLKQLGQITGDKSSYEEALTCYNKAIELNKETALYLVARSRLYVDIGKPEEAVQDIRKINELPIDESNQIYRIYVRNTQSDILKLDSIKNQIKQLQSNGEISPELSNILEQHASVTANLVVQVGAHSEKLGEQGSDITLLKSQVAALMRSFELFVQQSQRGEAISQSQIDELQQHIDTAKSNLQELDERKADRSELEPIKEHQELQDRKIQKHEDALIQGGVYDEVDVQTKLERLKNESPEIVVYYKTFYWTLVNYLQAYHLVASGIIATNDTFDQSTKNWIIETGVKKLSSLTAAVGRAIMSGQGLPIVGGAIGVLDKVVDVICETKNKHKFTNKKNAINKIIMSKFVTEKALDMCILETALAITESKKNEILLSKQGQLTKLEKVANILSKMTGGLKEVLIEKKVLSYEETEGQAAKIALADVTLLLAYLYTNADKVCEAQESLDKQIKIIVTSPFDISDVELALQATTDSKGNSVMNRLIDRLNSTVQKGGGVKHKETGIFGKVNEYGVIERIFSKECLEKKLQKAGIEITPDNIEETRIVLFKYMCSAIDNVKSELSLKCAKFFVEHNEYSKLITKIASEYPEYFVSEYLVKILIKDETLQAEVISTLNNSRQITGKGYGEHQENSYWHDYWYEYSKEAMDTILKLRLKSTGIENVKSVSIDHAFNESSKLYFAKDLRAKISSGFSDNIKANSSNDNNTTKLLIPINLDNKHWVGLVIEHSSDKIIAYYMDSEGEYIPEILKNSLENELVKLYPSLHIKIIEQPVASQKYNNCGLEVIENLVASCGIPRITEDEVVAIHSLLVEDKQLNDDDTIRDTFKIFKQSLLGENLEL
ncbi:Ulp1 family isopeptidase [Candidatus Tisiphia endosymbiont of Ceraclea dissimilis]|uniref:Ulp1 family isopeptidase n=1 Tax=Candidatus Tisiphia endosymbiont of Ceraclea dissimilis TaxID=3077928 RepID=UPI003CCB4496